MIGPSVEMARRTRRSAVAANLDIPEQRFPENDERLWVGHSSEPDRAAGEEPRPSASRSGCCRHRVGRADDDGEQEQRTETTIDRVDR